MSAQRAVIDAFRTLGFAGISASYANVGTAFTHLMRLICVTNNTDGDMIFSTDGITDQLFVAAGSFKLFDISTNREANDQLYLPAGTQFLVRQSTAPTKGAVYVEAVFGLGE